MTFLSNLLGGLFGLFIILGFIFWIKSWFEPDEKELLKDIRDEMRRKNKQNEPKEGRVL